MRPCLWSLVLLKAYICCVISERPERNILCASGLLPPTIFIQMLINNSNQTSHESCISPFVQETHQDLADRMGLHVVELRKERSNLPVVVASPTEGNIRTQPLVDEDNNLEMDFENLYYDGKIEYKKPKRKPFWEHLQMRSWKKKSAIVHRRRDQEEAQIRRQAGLA